MSTKNITLTELTRQERLLIWLRRAGLTNKAIAQATGVKPAAVTRWLESETIPPWRHAQLVELGIPVELLPPAVFRFGKRVLDPEATLVAAQ